MYKVWIIILLLECLMQKQVVISKDFLFKNTSTMKWNNFTTDDLISSKFTFKISNDIDMDICKALPIVSDIAMANNVHEADQYEGKIPDQVMHNEQYTHKPLLSTLNQNLGGKHLEIAEKLAKKGRKRRAATSNKNRLWDYGVIPYQIDSNFSGPHRSLFKHAMQHWENNTCVKFVERNPADHPNYIVFTIRPCGCCSFVGKRGNGGQAISIGKNCDKFGIVVHELGHVLGFWHEHTRPDRDEHVAIITNNIMFGQGNNFNKMQDYEVDSMGAPYDFESIMHYSRNTFSKGIYLDTIQPLESKTNNKQIDIGQRVRLSKGDIVQTNMLYRCKSCGSTLQAGVGIIESPVLSNVPLSCEWRITANDGEQIHLNISEVDILGNCETDYLLIQDGYWHLSPVLANICGTQTNVPLMIQSMSTRMLITLKTTLNETTTGVRAFRADYYTSCGGEMFVSDFGNLESPNYPMNYQPNKECIWKIKVDLEYQVALEFFAFDLESHDNCLFDFVEIRDGNSSSSPIIGVYCGFELPKYVQTSGNELWIRFVSDNSAQKTGFSARVIREQDECHLNTHDCDQECTNTLGGYRCQCQKGYELRSDQQTCEASCGGTIREMNGTIVSPSFPNVYPTSKYCVWDIIVPDQHRITLNFTHFDLEGGNYKVQECDYDSVQVFSKVDNETFIKHGFYCGTRRIPMITSETNSIRIIFISDNTIQKSGFAVIFSTDVDECAANNGGCMHKCRNTIGSFECSCENGYILDQNGLDCLEGGCKYEITAPYGVISTPNYPLQYNSAQICYWRITTLPGHRVMLHFESFNIEYHQECAFDHLNIYNGDSARSFTMGRFCGKTPPEITGSSNSLVLEFISDESLQQTGFKAFYSSVCGGRLIANETVNYFYSHVGYGSTDYNNGIICEWTIETEYGHNIMLTIEEFQLESEHTCKYDYFEMVDVYSATPKGRLCGKQDKQSFFSTMDTIIGRFRTDSTQRGKGFVMSYRMVDHYDEDNKEDEDYDGEVDSTEFVTPFPGYVPNVYGSEINQFK